MYILLLILHVIVCLVLVFVVLLQAGRGGGMSEMFGGGQPSSLFGTQTNVFLTRTTEVCAVLFVCTSVGLGLLTTQRSKSLMDRVHVTAAEMPKPLEVPKVPQAPEAVPTAPPVAAAANAPAPASAPAVPATPVQAAAGAPAVPSASAPASAGKPAE